jgi:hypothetical protein
LLKFYQSQKEASEMSQVLGLAIQFLEKSTFRVDVDLSLTLRCKLVRCRVSTNAMQEAEEGIAKLLIDLKAKRGKSTKNLVREVLDLVGVVLGGVSPDNTRNLPATRQQVLLKTLRRAYDLAGMLLGFDSPEAKVAKKRLETLLTEESSWLMKRSVSRSPEPSSIPH